MPKHHEVEMDSTSTDVEVQSNIIYKQSEEVQFTDSSTGADNVLWDFGDGNTSTERNPTHTYEENGEYVVTFTGFNDFGEASIQQTITVSGIGEEIPGIDVIEDEDPTEPDTYDPGEPPTDEEEEEDREQEEEDKEESKEEITIRSDGGNY